MPDEPKSFDVRTNAAWQLLGVTAKSAPRLQIDESEVPERFRQLIPYAERWGIDWDVRRPALDSLLTSPAWATWLSSLLITCGPHVSPSFLTSA